MATLIQENGIKELSKGTHGVVPNRGISTHSVTNHMVPDHEYCEAGSTSAQQMQCSNTSEPVAPPVPIEEEEETPEIDIMINNVVCSFSVKCHLNLRQIALNGVNVEFRRENGMVTMKLRRPYTTASIWSSGRVTCTGATSEDQAKVAARRYARALQKLGFQVRFRNFRVVNVLGTCRMPFGIRIISFSKKYKEADYEPELHPGVTYKLYNPKATLKIFSTGGVTITVCRLNERRMLLKSAGFVIVLLCTLSEGKTTQIDRHNARKFPKGFLFGTSTAAYQIEGGWDADGKSENIWDHMTHTDPCSTVDCSNGDIAGDSYNNYKRDVEMLRELGIDFYRFSLSWARILPTSFPDRINEAGAQYYSNLIDELLKYNIEPMVTLYHWDLPQRLQDLGGWANPEIADWFADYARIVYGLYGDRVKYWITINEPWQICYQGYGADTKAPRVNIKGVAEYLCAKNLVMAHAKAYHVYDEEFRPKYNGSIFIALSAQHYEPKTENEIEAAEESHQFMWGMYAHPIFSETGDFPPDLKEKVAAKSAEQGFFRSRLPEFTPEEVEYVKGTSDFFGLNHYSTYLVYRNESVVGLYDIPSFYEDLGNVHYQPDDWEQAASGFLKVVPWGFYKILTKIRKDYNNPTVYITENGFSNYGGLDDDDRISSHRRYLDAMLDAIDDGSDVRAYSIWSLMDNFEWMRGYTERFGLYEVDYESPERTRTPRKSAFVYKEMLRTRALDWHYEPDAAVMTIDDEH